MDSNDGVHLADEPVQIPMHGVGKGHFLVALAIEVRTDLDGLRVDGILPMCCNPPAATGALHKLRNAFGGAIGTYPRVGDVTGDYTPEEFADHGRRWIDAGVQVIGGCCNTTPDHIAALEPLAHH